MRSEPDQLQPLLVRLSVNQDKIRPDVAVSEFDPSTDQGMVAISLRQWLVFGERGHYHRKCLIKRAAITAT